MSLTLKQKLKADIDHLIGVKGKRTGNVLLMFFFKKQIRIVVLFRILNHYHSKGGKIAKLLLSPLHLYFRLMTNRYCIDLSPNTRIGPGFKLNHSYGIVVHPNALIGDNVYIAHNVTIGSKGPKNVPTIGNNVTICTGSIVIGNIRIGNNVVIGAGSLVVKDVPDNAIVGGHLAQIIKFNNPPNMGD